jgi:hypothetical protein
MLWDYFSIKTNVDNLDANLGVTTLGYFNNEHVGNLDYNFKFALHCFYNGIHG